MKKWIRNLALGLGIAAVGAGYLQHKSEQKCSRVYKDLESSIASSYDYIKNPSQENYQTSLNKKIKLNRSVDDFGEASFGNCMRKKGFLYIGSSNYAANDGFIEEYLGKIIETKTENGLKLYFTSIGKVNGLEGLGGLGSRIYNSQPFTDLDGKDAIYMDLDSIRSSSQKISDQWKTYAENHEKLTKRNKTWDPVKEAVYLSFKNNDYQSMAIRSTLVHEIRHITDKNSGQNFDRKTLEKRAYLSELMGSPFVLHQLEIKSKAKNKSAYQQVGKEIIEDLIKESGKKTKMEFYEVISKNPNILKDLSKKAYDGLD